MHTSAQELYQKNATTVGLTTVLDKWMYQPVNAGKKESNGTHFK
jgi:hypothetical protein